jgi:hypothetical protein
MFSFAKDISLPVVGRLRVGISISRSRARNSAVAVELLVPLELEIKEKKAGVKIWETERVRILETNGGYQFNKT